MGHDLEAAIAAADRALAIADDDASRALEVANHGVLCKLHEAGLAVAEAKAFWARGLAFRKLGQHKETLDALNRAEELLLGAGEDYEANRVAIPLAFERALLGQVDDAVSALESAAQQLTGTDAALASAQLALVLHRAGRDNASMVAWDNAIDTFRAVGSPRLEARALFNRGIIRAEWGDFHGAETDLCEAAKLNEEIGDEFELVGIAHNLGYTAARQGNLALALRWFDDSQRRAMVLGVQRPEMLLDRADTLAEAGLFAEARAVVEEAINLLEALHQRADLAEACLSAARICLAQGQAPQAHEWARRARQDFHTQGRSRWIPVARYYEILSQSGWSRTDRAHALLKLSGPLKTAGWETLSYEADAIAVDLLLQARSLEAVRDPLDRLRRLQKHGTNLDRLLAWTAETRFRASEGHYSDACRSMDAAVNALVAHQAANGSMELRVQGAGRADEAVELALVLGRAMQSPVRALGWIERIRSSQEPRGMQDDPEMARRLEDLRQVTTRLESSPAGRHEQRRLRARQRALEELVRRQGRHVAGRKNPSVLPRSPQDLIDSLEERVLIEYIPSGDRLAAVVFEGGKVRCIDLPPIGEVRRAVAGLRMTLVGIVADHRNSDLQRSTELDKKLAALSSLLLDPLGLADSKTEAVIVPWGAVGSVPWGALATFKSRPVVVAPSATAWTTAFGYKHSNGASSRSHVVVICGPGLVHSAEEADAIREIWGPETRVLSGEEATVQEVMDFLSSADLVHFATHGSFRSDSPLLSSLQLADGPLTGYDLSRLDRVPTTVVLSCCETGMAGADSPGTFGLCGLLLASGARSIVASVVPVVDESAFHFTIPFHRELQLHGRVSEALLAAQRESSCFDYSGLGFCCFGAG